MVDVYSVLVDPDVRRQVLGLGRATNKNVSVHSVPIENVKILQSCLFFFCIVRVIFFTLLSPTYTGRFGFYKC